ncbi:hypothetical protein GCM10009672_15780 [Nesterenkonia lutea]
MRYDLGRGGVGGAGQQVQLDPEFDGGRGHHAGQLTVADHPDPRGAGWAAGGVDSGGGAVLSRHSPQLCAMTPPGPHRETPAPEDEVPDS